tara:strand:+ start:279 stop:1697 length:1419 start_codon:yes stop_codon:yes gene_type:complete
MKIEITSEKERFNEHLNIENNNNIIFSGIFGIGKTYFLKEFFEENKDFTPIFISPVHYSISSNKDIINYIKYDVIFELLKMDLNYEYEKIPLKFTSQQFILENITQIFSNILSHTGKIGKLSSEIINNISKFYEKVKEHQDKYVTDDKKELIDFLTKITLDEGSLYEENNITLIISSLLKQIKNPILIIDDIDRLDPEHIFRILNVFAGHLNINGTYSNKFSFEKILIVCDINNIKNIFSSKYGLNTDFNGYIDKFFHQQIFHFDNRNEIINNISNIFNKITANQQIKIFNDSYYPNLVLKLIVSELIENNCLNLRTLIKTNNYVFKLRNNYLLITEEFKLSAFLHNYSIINIFQFLSEILGSKSNLEEVLKKYIKTVKEKTIYIGENKYLFSPFIFFIDYKKHKQKEGKYQYRNEEFNLTVNYEINNQGYSSNIRELEFKNFKDEQLEYFPYSKILLEAFNIYSEIKYDKN